jgi:hypothetical protein
MPSRTNPRIGPQTTQTLTTLHAKGRVEIDGVGRHPAAASRGSEDADSLGGRVVGTELVSLRRSYMLSAEHQGAPQLMNATRMALGIQIVNMALRQAELKLHGSRASGQESSRENYECVSQLVAKTEALLLE